MRMYWAKEYHMDGFRFDLMGLLTVELMNRIKTELDREFGEGEKILYGEPWSAADSPMESGTRAASKKNADGLMDGIAIFCDDTRDAIKGDVFKEKEPGFVNGGKGATEAESFVPRAAARLSIMYRHTTILPCGISWC